MDKRFNLSNIYKLESKYGYSKDIIQIMLLHARILFYKYQIANMSNYFLYLVIISPIVSVLNLFFYDQSSW